MGIWNFYFITKLFLYFGRYMGFHVWLNLAFATFIAIPIPEKYARYRKLRQYIAILLGISLFYFDTWLPPISRAFSQASEIEGFSLTYLTELVGRFINPWVVAGLALSYVIYHFAKKKLRIASFVFIAMLVPLFPFGQMKAQVPAKTETAQTTENYLPPATETNLTAYLQNFYRTEKERSVSFSPPSKSDAPFDIIFLQVCSLSWDDIDFSKEQDNPLFKRFNIVFTNFSSAASYSGPAAIRLLRGSCGQPRHKELYGPSAQQCRTFDNLHQIGFEQQFAMNHDGHYGNFLGDVRDRGGLTVSPLDLKGLPAYLQSFDGSPVHDDYDVLTRWLEKRMKSSTERVALFYNTISLHDGNYYAGRRTNSMEIYHPRLTQLLKDMDHFFNDLQASGRKAVVVFVAEHGASVRGDKMQIAGLREIPSPRISAVPVGIKLIGFPDDPAAKPILITKPTSHFAVAQLLSDFITISPFGKTLSLDDYIKELPSTEFVAENEDVVVMRYGKQYYIHAKDADWVEYDTSAE